MSSGNFEKLKKWIRFCGGYISPNIKVVRSKIGNIIQNSVYATKIIQSNEEILRIPKICKLDGELIYKIPNIEQWINIDKNSLIKNSFVLRIVIALIYQKSLGKKSFYYPYIKHLPKSTDFIEHPIYNYSEDMIEEWTKCSPSFSLKLQILMRNFKKLNDFITMCMKQYPIIDLSKFGTNPGILDSLVKWGFLIFLTRSWTEQGCIPFADFFNHKSSSPIILNHYPEKVRKGISVMEIKTTYETGDEIFNHYGHWDNKELYLNYGFWDNEPVKFMKFAINFNTTTPLSYYISELIKNEKISPNRVLLTSSGPSGLLIKFMRISSLSDSDVHKVNTLKNNNKFGVQPISPSNEVMVFKNLLRLINKLRANEYSVERFNDCKMLFETSDNIVTKNLTQIIISEYEVIKNCVVWAHANWIAKLETPILNDIINFISTLDIA